MISRLVKNYNNLLIKYPLRTKCITSSIIMCSADVTVQTQKKSLQDVNFLNSLKYGIICGGLQKAPFMHFFYNISDKWRLWKQLLFCSLIIDPINYSCAMMCNSVIYGGNIKNGLSVIQKNFWSVYVTGLQIWPGIQFITFYYIPLHWRVIYFNSMSYIWNVWLTYKLHKQY